jgi:beta-glucanase (GH16 family)
LLILGQLHAYPQTGGWRLVWGDEFNGTALDAAKWEHETGQVRNQEALYYAARTENARVEGGNLILEARKEAYQGAQYTSGSIQTKGQKGWKYGRFEVRAKLPTGRGIWPGIWLLGNAPGMNWPRIGEIDIMEHVGFEPGVIHGTIHCEAYNHVKGTQKGATASVPGLATDFHLYRVEWSSTRIEFFVDSLRYFTFNKDANATVDQWPFDLEEFLKLNVAVGGSWGGEQGIDDKIFPQRMTVDYARVYQWDNTVTAIRPPGSRTPHTPYTAEAWEIGQGLPRLRMANGRLRVYPGLESPYPGFQRIPPYPAPAR